MKALVRAYDWLIMALAWLAGAMTLAIFVLVVVDVTAREVVGSSLNYTVGTVEYALLYFTMFAAPYLVRTHGHVYIEALITRLPEPVRRVQEKLVYVICAVSCAVFAVVSTMLLVEKIETGVIDIRGVDFPGWLIVAPMPVCYGLVTLEFLRFLFGADSMYRAGGPASNSL